MKNKEISEIKKWRKLDNAAKVFPATVSKKNTKVFRFYCELHDKVEEEYLQLALDQTLELFPFFKTVMRKGVFWYYLEDQEYRPIVREESKPPCTSIYDAENLKYLFRVNYYKKRINFEVFHVLTDGTGATEFMRELVKNYLYLCHQDEGLEAVSLLGEVPLTELEEDSFTSYYSKESKAPMKVKRISQQIQGKKSHLENLQVYEGVVETSTIIKKAKEHGVSISVYLTAVYLCAIQAEKSIKEKHNPVVLMVLVNLRNFFPSKSMFNFFGYIDPSYTFTEGETSEFTKVLEAVDKYFKEELTKDKMGQRMNEYTRLEKHPVLRYVPLHVKNFAIMMGAAAATKDISAIFSNMSVVKMPESYEPYIKQFGVLMSTPKMELCMCSFKERMVLNFTSYFDSSSVKDHFFRLLEEDGVVVERVKDQFPIDIEDEGDNKIQWFKIIGIISTIFLVLRLIFKWNKFRAEVKKKLHS